MTVDLSKRLMQWDLLARVGLVSTLSLGLPGDPECNL